MPAKPSPRALVRLTAHLEDLKRAILEDEAQMERVRLGMARLVPMLSDWELEFSSTELGEARQSVVETVREALEDAGQNLTTDLEGGDTSLEDVPDRLEEDLRQAIEALEDWE